MKSTADIEAENRRKYSGAAYDASTICRPVQRKAQDYASRMLALKVDMVARDCPGDVLVDLCCGAGEHLRATANARRLALGIDFSVPFLQHGEQNRRGTQDANVAFICGNARTIPLAQGSVDAVYSLSSLYYMPSLEAIVAEIARVLRPGGRCVLDLGARPSLNTIVCAAYPELAVACHVPEGEILSTCRANGLTVLRHRRFQILPMWGDRPAWLKPLLLPMWTRLLAVRIGGRMLDEWISSLPLLRRFAFRRVLLCERVSAAPE